MGPGWVDDNAFPELWSDISPADTTAYGYIAMGSSNVFCYGGVNRNRCGFEPYSRALRTLGDVYHAAGLEISDEPIGARRRRTMGETAGAVISIATGESTGVYSRHSHIPFPNTPLVRGIGLEFPPAAQSEYKSMVYRSVILGGILLS